MEEIRLRTNDFLFNAGMLGFYRIMKNADKSCKIKLYRNEIIFNPEILENFETDYINAMINSYEKETAFTEIMKIYSYIKSLENLDDENVIKDSIKKITDKIIKRKSYESGVEIVKSYGDNTDIYIMLDNIKEEQEATQKILILDEIIIYLKKYKEIFCMKDIIYNKIGRFWQDMAFLNKQNNKKDIKQAYKERFVDTAIEYTKNDRKGDCECIQCGNKMKKSDSIGMAWLKDVGVDIKRKTSAFWDFHPDTYICPICAIIYSCVPLGFNMVGQDGIFMNNNQSFNMLDRMNTTQNLQDKMDTNGIYNNIFYQILKYKDQQENEMRGENELNNIQIIRRKTIRTPDNKEIIKYILHLIAKDKLQVFNDTQDSFKNLIKIKYKIDDEYIKYINVYEEVLENFLQSKKQYSLINRLIYVSVKESRNINFIDNILKIQLNCIGGMKVEITEKEVDDVKTAGKSLREYFSRPHENVDHELNGYIYQLINSLKVNNKSKFMEIFSRMYCGIGKDIPFANQFEKMLIDDEAFQLLGYAYILGLKDNKKKEGNNNG